MICKLILFLVVLYFVLKAIYHRRSKPNNENIRFKGYEELHDEMYQTNGDCQDCGHSTPCADISKCPNFSMLREDQ